MVEFRPALDTEAPLLAGSDLLRDWSLDPAGTPKYLLRLALLLREAGDPRLCLARPPAALRRVIPASFVGGLAPFGRLLGYEA